METKELTRSNGINGWLTPLRNAILGRQNERLEFIMDSYFKLSPEGRTAVVVGGVAGSIFLLISIIGIYLAALTSLQARLDSAFEAVNTLKDARYSYTNNKQKFADLERKLEAANQNLILISVLETKAKELGLQTSGFPAQLPTSDFAASNPLAGKYQNAKVKFNISNVSLKRIMDLVIAIEATPHLLRVVSLTIKPGYQNKLFFESTLEVEGTVTKR
jgi:hypothetical protein